MASVDEKIQKLKQEPDSFVSEDIEELIDEIGDDTDKCIDVWCSTSPNVQREIPKVYERLMEQSKDDIKKQVKIWSKTNVAIQTKHPGDFERMLNNTQNRIYNESKDILKRRAMMSFLDLISNTASNKVVVDKKDSIMDTFDYLYNTNLSSEYSNLIFNELLRFEHISKNHLEYQRILLNYIQDCREEYSSTRNIAYLINIYNNKEKLTEILPKIEKTFAFFKKEMINNPNAILQSIVEGKLEIVDKDVYGSLLEADATTPELYVKALKNLINRRCNSDTKEALEDKDITIKLFSKLNGFMPDTNYTKHAYDVFDMEMKFSNSFKNDANFISEVTRTLGRCKGDCEATKSPDKLLKICKNNMENIDNLINGTSDSNELVAERKRLKLALDYVKDTLKEYPNESIKALEKDVLKYFDVEFFCKAINDMRESGEDVSKYLDGVKINASQLKELTTLENIPEGLKVSVICKDASEISVEDIDRINGKFECKDISFDDKNIEIWQKKPYLLEEYKVCRKRIDEVLEDIIIPPIEDRDREKKIFGQVMTRLSSISYNHSHVDADESIIKVIDMFNSMSIEDKERNKETINALYKAQNSQDFTTPRNLVGGLIEGNCVCAGYAEIVRNTLACCGIEATYVCGFTVDGKSGHAWNQVKLDGEWFNMDLTWARDQLVKAKEKNIIFDLLVNDEVFNSGGYCFNNKIYQKGGHEKYSEKRSSEHKCDRTIQPNELMEYITQTPEKGISYKECLEQFAMESRTGKIKEVDRILYRDMQMEREGGKTNVKEQRDR